jgi:hypothetical protein
MEIVCGNSRNVTLRTCIWGTVRKGYRRGEVETFCRFINPNGLVPVAVRECSAYVDSRAPCAAADSKANDRRFGFVTTPSLDDKTENLNPWEQLKYGVRLSVLQRPGAGAPKKAQLDFRFLFAILTYGRGNGKQAVPAPLPFRLSRARRRLL